MKNRKSYPDAETVMNAVARDDGTGFCLSCGAETLGCEPDAREYPCDACGEHEVYGAEECLFMTMA